MDKGTKNAYDALSLESKSDAVCRTTTGFRSMTLFCTVFLTSLVLGGCVLGAVWMTQNGSDPSECTGFIPAGENAGSSNHDKARDTMMQMEDGEILTEHFQYDQASNTLLIYAPPSNFSGYTQATVALDYDRSHAFVNIHDADICIAFPWPAEMANKIQAFMSDEDEETDVSMDDVPDILSLQLPDVNDMDIDEIPAGFLQVSSGSATAALCGGKSTYWLEDNMVSPRQRRAVVATAVIVIALILVPTKAH